MLDRIRKYIKQVFSFEKKLNGDIERVSNLNNVSIHATNGISTDTVFSIDPLVEKFSTDINVGCRKFCSFLVGPAATLIIKEGVYFNNYCSINCLGYIEIGDNTLFGEGVKIYDHNHSYSFQNQTLIVKKSDFNIGKIVIGKNSWIGSNVCILNNVEIGDNVIIGANCLVYKSIPSNSIVKHTEQLIIEQKKSE